MRVFLSALVSLLVVSHELDAVDFTLSAEQVTVFPGKPALVSILFNSSGPISGFSLGVVHDPGVLTLMSIEQGATIAAINQGQGADYFFTSLDPVGGPGGFVACVLSLQEPLEMIPTGSGHELVLNKYGTGLSASPGHTTPVEFSGDLGDPPVPILVADAELEYSPTTSPGSVFFANPPVTDLVCSSLNLVVCPVQLTWSNGGPYDLIQILQDGLVLISLPGNATSTQLILPGAGQFQLCVVAIRNFNLSQPKCCKATCAPEDPIAEPTDLTCSFVEDTCQVQLSWINNDVYDEIEVFVDGISTRLLPGDAQSTTVNILQDNQQHQVCLVARISRQAAIPVCCGVTCAPEDPIAEPTDLTCSLDESTCQVQLSWLNNDVYDEIEVFVDGVSTRLLPGDAQSTTVNILQDGQQHLICLVARRSRQVAIPVCCGVTCAGVAFVRGDCNGDGPINIADSIFLLNLLFVSPPPVSTCQEACNTNGDLNGNIADVIYGLNFLFADGPSPLPPWPLCESLANPPLGCDSYSSCL